MLLEYFDPSKYRSFDAMSLAKLFGREPNQDDQLIDLSQINYATDFTSNNTRLSAENCNGKAVLDARPAFHNERSGYK